MRFVSLEEHFRTHDLLRTQGELARIIPEELTSKLRDVGEGRIRDMDVGGVDVQVLGAGGPGFQTISGKEAVDGCRRTNDLIAQAIARHPTRLYAFATLPVQASKHAVNELERCVRELGFRGAMIHGHVNGRFLDDPAFWPIFEAAESLRVPIYLHPTLPPAAVRETYYAGLDDRAAWTLATAAWGWHTETGLHALRLIIAGVFTRFPRLQVIVGHMGEGLPFFLDRADVAFRKALPDGAVSVSECFHRNFYVTTSGFFDPAVLMFTLQSVGADRLLFSVDYPYEDIAESRAFLETSGLAVDQLHKIAHANADRLLGL